MTVRNTSKAAYLNVNGSGKCAVYRRRIMDFVTSRPGVTRKDISRALDLEINIVTPRVRELLNSGLLVEDGCRRDPGTRNSQNLLYIAEGSAAA